MGSGRSGVAIWKARAQPVRVPLGLSPGFAAQPHPATDPDRLARQAREIKHLQLRE